VSAFLSLNNQVLPRQKRSKIHLKLFLLVKIPIKETFSILMIFDQFFVDLAFRLSQFIHVIPYNKHLSPIIPLLLLISLFIFTARLFCMPWKQHLAVPRLSLWSGACASWKWMVLYFPDDFPLLASRGSVCVVDGAIKQFIHTYFSFSLNLPTSQRKRTATYVGTTLLITKNWDG